MGMFQAIASLISGAVKPVTKVIDEVHTSNEEKLQLRNALAQLVNDLTIRIVEYFEKELEARKEIILAEIQASWLTQNWRPLLMLMIIGMVFNNFVMVPYLNSIFGWSVTVVLPDKLYSLLTAGVGGYVGGRSVEKIVKTIKGK